MFYASFVFSELGLTFQSVQGGIEKALKRFGERLELIILPFAMVARFNEAGAT